MATRKLAQSQLMMQAGQAGEQAVQRAHEARSANIQQTAGRAESARQFDEQVDQQNLNRWQRQWEERRANEAEKSRFEATLAEQQRQFDVSGERQESQLGQQQELRREENVQQQQQFQSQQDLQAAAQGLMAAPDPRLQSMQAEMQRGGEQMAQGLETSAQGRKFIPTPEGKQAQEAQQQVAASEADTKRINAVASYQRATNEYRIAEMRVEGAKTASARTDEKAAMKELGDELIKPVESSAAMLNRMMDFKGTAQDWNTARSMINPGDNPLAGDLLEMKEALDREEWTPRLQKFMEQQVAVKALRFIAATGRMPEGDLVDSSSEAMQAFSRNTVQAAQLLGLDGGDTGPGRLLSVRGQVERIKYINRLAANLTMSGKPSQPQQQGQPPGGGSPMPAPAAPGAFEQFQAQRPNEQRRDPATGQPPPGGQTPYRGAPEDLPGREAASKRNRFAGNLATGYG